MVISFGKWHRAVLLKMQSSCFSYYKMANFYSFVTRFCGWETAAVSSSCILMLNAHFEPSDESMDLLYSTKHQRLSKKSPEGRWQLKLPKGVFTPGEWCLADTGSARLRHRAQKRNWAAWIEKDGWWKGLLPTWYKLLLPLTSPEP